MSKAAPPLLGFNNNVRHRGRIFHIQTEDSGIKFPRIVTHLFADGGRIVKTTRTDYAEHVEKPDMATVVRGMMKDQHKAMFAALRAGDMDGLLENVCGPLEPAKSKAPESVGDPTAKNDLETARVLVSSIPSVAAKPGEPSNLPIPVAPGAQLTQPAPVAEVLESMKSLRDAREAEEARAARRPISNPNLRKPTPSVTPPAAEAFDLDVASLDKNPPKASHSPPPPPVRVARKSNPAPRKSRPPIPQRPAAAAVGAAPPAPAVAAAAAAASLARPPTRTSPVPQGGAPRSIFGDGAISEQSLDEVILSYLAEDLEEPK